MSKFIKNFFYSHKYLIVIVGIYIGIMLPMLSWGVPNPGHPFTYHMDEWHQLMAVRSLFSQGSSNVEGAANGPIFFFLTVGVYLLPFYVLHIVDPFAIKSSLSSLHLQQQLFEILRLNSVMFGIGSLTLMWVIAKRYLKISPFISTSLFMMTPIWIMLSNYFKYDIALTFFHLLSLVGIYHFSDKPTAKRFYLAAIPIGCAMSIKISAMPLIIIYILSYFLFISPKKRSIKHPILGLAILALTFCLVGIPDMVTRYKAYYEFFYSNLVDTPSETPQYKLGMPILLYIPYKIFPLMFGHTFYLITLVSIGYFMWYIKDLWKKDKRKFLIFLTCILFLLSLVPLKIYASGNRSLVLLPFMSFLVAMFFDALQKVKIPFVKMGTIIVIVFIMLFQSFEVYAWMRMKLAVDPRQSSSSWMVKNLPKQSEIGIENIPIYQGIPDIALKEFYELQDNPKAATRFSYKVVDSKTTPLPRVIILTNVDYTKAQLNTSPKLDLLHVMEKQGYRVIKTFKPSRDIYSIYADPNLIQTAGLIPQNIISVYQR